MSMGSIGSNPFIGDRTSEITATESKAAASTATELRSEQVVAQEKSQAEASQDVFRPLSKQELKSLDKRKVKIPEKSKVKGVKSTESIKQAQEKAKEHAKKNPELKEESLVLLRRRVLSDEKGDILETLKEFYPDPTNAADALNFLLDTTEGELNTKIKNALNELEEQKGREIQAGRNINVEARQAADKGLGTPTAMRDLYRDVTGNPRDASTMFKELNQKYAYKEMSKVINFLLHAAGSDLRSKGPSIPRGELHNLMSETRVLQAILQVYRFCNNRMPLVKKLFNEV